MGQRRCMEGQIDLTSYRMRVERAQKRRYLQKNDEKAEAPFRHIIFQKAYIALKRDGKIQCPEILEFRKQSSYEVYESLYLNALQRVYTYCKARITAEYQADLLSDAYMQEFDWMKYRFNVQKKQNNTA